MLPDLHLLDGLSERSSVSDSVLSGDTHFLGSLGLGLEEREGEGDLYELTVPELFEEGERKRTISEGRQEARVDELNRTEGRGGRGDGRKIRGKVER